MNDAEAPKEYTIGSVVYQNSPAYELPEGGSIRRPGLDPKNQAQPPMFDDKDPIRLEIARINGNLVRPDSGLLPGAQIIGDPTQPLKTETEG
jgi:hypothetical protein